MTNRELAEALWKKILEEREESARQKCYAPWKLTPKGLDVVYRLLENDKSAPIFPFVCEELLKHLTYRDIDYLKIKKNLLEAVRMHVEQGHPDEFDIHQLEKDIAFLENRAEYLSKIEDAAEHGEWDSYAGELIDGFDLINGEIGSFHDSELLDVVANHEEDFVELTFYMSNGADCLFKIRFEGNIDYNCYVDCIRVYLSFGYFYRQGDFVTLALDGWGEVSARHAHVISVTPNPEDQDE